MSNYNSWWPLPLAGWLFIGATLLIIVLLIIAIVKIRAKRQTWQYQANLRLRKLSRQPIKLAENVSQEVRFIAIRKYSKSECAVLAGRAWLAWLKQHDPQGFDWEKHGEILIKNTYEPPDKQQQYQEEIEIIIEAIKNWL